MARTVDKQLAPAAVPTRFAIVTLAQKPDGNGGLSVRWFTMPNFGRADGFVVRNWAAMSKPRRRAHRPRPSSGKRARLRSGSAGSRRVAPRA